MLPNSRCVVYINDSVVRHPLAANHYHSRTYLGLARRTEARAKVFVRNSLGFGSALCAGISAVPSHRNAHDCRVHTHHHTGDAHKRRSTSGLLQSARRTAPSRAAEGRTLHQLRHPPGFASVCVSVVFFYTNLIGEIVWLCRQLPKTEGAK